MQSPPAEWLFCALLVAWSCALGAGKIPDAVKAQQDYSTLMGKESKHMDVFTIFMFLRAVLGHAACVILVY